MRTAELDYELPAELIAQQPVTPRDSSRLLVYERASGAIADRQLPDLLDYLKAGDVLVANDSRVLPARLHLYKQTGGRVELLFLQQRKPRLWEALVRPSARLREGTGLWLAATGEGEAFRPAATDITARGGAAPDAVIMLESNLGGGRWLVRNTGSIPTTELLEREGRMPLPPYIHERLREPERYQTVYAREPGSAAAPTAGLHFTEALLDAVRAKGVAIAPVTLHVGLDTFRPVAAEELDAHEIHSERYRMPRESFEKIGKAKRSGGRVLAVGTTSVRVLETVFRDVDIGKAYDMREELDIQLEGDTTLFITPGFRFRAVDCLLTNFHLPHSTLLALVMAFAGVGETRRIYREAIARRYRFFSFGDAMLVI